MVANQFSLTIKTFRSDGGGEFTSDEFKPYLLNHGITHHISCPHTPQQNGVVERKHRHIIETAIMLLSQASLPSSFWTFAVQTALTLINFHPTLVLNWKSPWFRLYSTLPNLTQLKVFGCACYPHLRPYTAHKLEPRTRECIFICYPTHSKGYLCLDPQSKHVYTSRHVVFNEAKFPGLPSTQSVSSFPHTSIPTWLSNQLYFHSTNQPSLLGSYPSSTLPSLSPTSQPTLVSSSQPMPLSTSNTSSSPHNPISHSSPTSVSDPPLPINPPMTLPIPSLNSHPMQTRSKNGITKPKSKLCYKATIDYSYTKPPSYKIASQYPKWCEAMDAEFQALQR